MQTSPSDSHTHRIVCLRHVDDGYTTTKSMTTSAMMVQLCVAVMASQDKRTCSTCSWPEFSLTHLDMVASTRVLLAMMIMVIMGPGSGIVAARTHNEPSSLNEGHKWTKMIKSHSSFSLDVLGVDACSIGALN